jgi:hypothetical protein
MKDLTIKQYNELKKIQIKAYLCINRMKEWNPESKMLNNYRRQFYDLAEQLGVLGNDGETLRYTCKALNLDYSYGYNFGDVLA